MINFSDAIVAAYVQTISGIIVGGAAIYIAIRANKRADKQFKENRKSSDLANQSLLNQIKEISEINSKQQKAADKLLIEIKKISRPILSLSNCKSFIKRFERLNTGYYQAGVFRYILENIGERKANNIRFELYFFDEDYAIMHKEKGGIIEVLYPNSKTDFVFDKAEITHNEKYYYLCLTFNDEEIEGEINQPYYFRIDLNFEFKKCDSDEMAMIDSSIVAQEYRKLF